MTLGKGRYKVEIAEPGVGDQRGDVVCDLTQFTESLKWNRVKSNVSVFQATVDSEEAVAKLAEVRTVLTELRITRNDKIVCEGPLTRKETTDDQVRLVGSDLMWWLQRRFLSGATVNQALVDIAEIARRVFDDSVLRTDLFEATMDPGLAAFLTTTNTGHLGQSTVSAEDFRTAFAELRTWVRTTMDFTVLRRSTLIGSPAANTDFGLISRAHILGKPKLTERGDLYCTDFTAFGSDGVARASASVENVTPGSVVPAHLRAYDRGSYSTVKSLSALQAIADAEVRTRFPAPEQLEMGSAAWLSPDTPVDIDNLIPTATGQVEVNGRTQPVSILKVTGRLSKKGVEKISINTEPVSIIV